MWNNDLRMILDNMSMFIDMNHLTIDRSRDQGCGGRLIQANTFSYYY